MRYLTFAIFLAALINSCSTTPVRAPETAEEIPAKPQALNENNRKNLEEYFNSVRQNDEMFRIFVSSDTYQIKQFSALDKISIEPDPNGNAAFIEQIAPYNKVDYLSNTVIKVELFHETGKIFRARPIRPSGIGEIDKLIFDDIMRWKFVFKDKKVDPDEFNVGVAILLQKKVSRDEALKEVKENLQKK